MKTMMLLLLLGNCAMAAETMGAMSSDNLFTTARSVFPNPPPMASISHDGDVMIDWDQVEKTAADENANLAVERAYARLMLAIRNGTWKPAPSK